ncbi:MAG: phosphoglucosamine mutase [Deltaproteobacteria bacterium]|nr:phosphoglucosamine mutase [Deltaproteobacteria bacterium]
MANSVERRLFGTDGVRGLANLEPMTSEMALKLGRAIACVLDDPVLHRDNGLVKKRISGSRLRQGNPKHRTKILIGKDTRLSGYMLETALASGICSMGADVLQVGPLPTPGVAFLTRSMRADAGVVISASHNPFQDNGIKFFSADGFKLPDAAEARMEEMIFGGDADLCRATASEIGKAFRIADAVGRYIVFLKNTFPRFLTLEGLRIVVDCGHGAAYRVAPEVLAELGAEVIPIGVQPDGENINRDCGSLYPETARQAVLEHHADLGISLDGDGDRSVFIDDEGDVLDGDSVLAICAREMQSKGVLNGGTVVATVMSNLGLDLALQGCGIKVVRTAVGDRHVVEEMLGGGYNLGGEQSGHIVFLDQNTTGDGCLTGLQLLAIMVEKGQRLAELKKIMTKLPQVLLNVGVREKREISQLPRVHQKIRTVEKQLGNRGRILVRYSGTEPLVRIMLEGENEDHIRGLAQEIAEEIRRELGMEERSKTVNELTRE